MTLLEVLIALSLSLSLLTLLFSLYLCTEKQYHRQQALQALLADFKVSTELLRRELSLAGYVGCAWKLPNSLKLGLDVQGQQHLLVQHRSLDAVLLLEGMNKPTELYLSPELKFTEGEWLLISDCQAAEVFEVAKVKGSQQGQLLFAKQALKKRYSKGAEIGRWESNDYWVEKSKGLQRKGLQGPKITLVKSLRGLDALLSSGSLSLHLSFSQGTFSKPAYIFVRL